MTLFVVVSERCTIHALERRAFDEPVVVIDVIRAFTTAAAAFDAGARDILCVEELEGARHLKDVHGDAILIGEERGQRPEGFDYGNSPTQFAGASIEGRRLIQRTSHGTRGLLWIDAPLVLAAAAVNAAATADYLSALGEPFHLVCTWEGTDEDRACAEHIKCRVEGRRTPDDRTAQRILEAGAGHRRLWTRKRTPEEIAEFDNDVRACAAVDAHPYVMVAHKRGDVVHLSTELP